MKSNGGRLGSPLNPNKLLTIQGVDGSASLATRKSRVIEIWIYVGMRKQGVFLRKPGEKNSYQGNQHPQHSKKK